MPKETFYARRTNWSHTTLMYGSLLWYLFSQEYVWWCVFITFGHLWLKMSSCKFGFRSLLFYWAMFIKSLLWIIFNSDFNKCRFYEYQKVLQVHLDTCAHFLHVHRSKWKDHLWFQLLLTLRTTYFVCKWEICGNKHCAHIIEQWSIKEAFESIFLLTI